MSQEANNVSLDSNLKSNRNLWWVPIAFGLLFYVVIYIYQSGSDISDISFQHHEVIHLTDGPDSLVIDFAYPQVLPLDQRNVENANMAFALWHDAPPTHVQSYTITITFSEAEQAIIITDLENNLVVPRFTLTPTLGTASPVASQVFYLRRSLIAVGEPCQITPTLRIQSPSSATPFLEKSFKPIKLQSRCAAWWRQFCSLILGPATPLLTIAAGLVGFALTEVQRWRNEQIEARKRERDIEKRAKQQEKEARNERQKRKVNEALANIKAQADISERVRCYMSYITNPEPMWREESIKARLQKAWNEEKRGKINCIIKLSNSLTDEEHFYRDIEELGVDRGIEALEWAIQYLDHEWQQKAVAGLYLLSKHPEHNQSVTSEVLENIEQKRWCAILQGWPALSLWRGFPLPTDPAVSDGLSFLSGGGVKSNIFGSGQAETDPLLLKCRVDPPWLANLRQPEPALLAGDSGSGRTATALLLAYDALHDLNVRDAFPVYYPATFDALELVNIASMAARTLLHYLAVAPAGFLRQGTGGRAAIANLLALYAAPNLTQQLHLAGLPFTEDGIETQKIIEDLAEGSSFQGSVPDDELLSWLSKARPHDFRYTMILLDLQEQADQEDNETTDAYLKSLNDLSNTLARVGIFVKAFLPHTLQASLRKYSGELSTESIELQWSEEYLATLLKKYLEPLQNESWTEWFDRRDFDEDDWALVGKRLFEAAQGTPAGLIQVGNELLQRIGEEQRLLRLQDFNMIVGSLTRQPDEDKVEL